MGYRIVKRRTSNPPRIICRRTERKFVPLYHQWWDEIQALAYNAYVPGWSQEDVAAEMALCLWYAFKRFSPLKGKDFGKYWWSIWLNRRAEQIRYLNAAKRALAEEVLMGTELEDVGPVMIPDYFTTMVECGVEDKLKRTAWVLIGVGWLPDETRRYLRISQADWDAMLESWRTESVRLLLTYAGG